MIRKKKILTAAEYEQRKNAAKRAGRKAGAKPHRSTIWRRKKNADALAPASEKTPNP